MIASAALILGAFIAPADAKKKTKRTERTAEATYYGAAVGVCNVPATGRIRGLLGVERFGCARFWTTSKEKYLSIEIADTLPTTVSARVMQDLGDVDNLLTQVAFICGLSEEPIPITPGADVGRPDLGREEQDARPGGLPRSRFLGDYQDGLLHPAVGASSNRLCTGWQRTMVIKSSRPRIIRGQRGGPIGE